MSSDTLIATKNTQGRGSATAEVSTLRYRHRALWLLCLYVPLLIVPWSLTCVLVFRPVNEPSYYSLDGLPEYTLTFHRRLVNAINIINSFTSIITVPLISALIAQAAVVHAQKRRKKQSLSVRQTFALADRAWSNLGILLQAWPPWKTSRPKSRTIGSGFLWIAAFFLLECMCFMFSNSSFPIKASAEPLPECMVTIPIREGFTSTASTLVMSARDHRSWSGRGFSTAFQLGTDAEPYDMATTPEEIVVQDVMNGMAVVSMPEVPLNLWTDNEGEAPFRPTRGSLGSIVNDITGPWQLPHASFFVAALPNGTTTGVYKHRLMRLNSTVTSKEIPQSAFQNSCREDSGFSTTFIRPGQLEVRMCVAGPRNMQWTLSRNRQKISEDFFLDVKHFASLPENNATTNFTRQYTVQTLRGYFEMGNYQNNMGHGPLLERWEDLDPYNMSTQYNDRMSKYWLDQNVFDRYMRIFQGKPRVPTAEDKLTDIPGWPAPQSLLKPWPRLPGAGDINRTAAGPLMMTVLAMFGDNSLFAMANRSTEITAQDTASQICDTGRMPLSKFYNYQTFAKECALRDQSGGLSSEELLTSLISRFVMQLEDAFTGRKYFSIGAFFANRAMLLQTVSKSVDSTARPIYSAPGQYLQKPSISTAGIIIVSAFILIQLIALAYLTWYIYQVPTWTTMLDALAVARITASLDKGDVPAIGSLCAQDLLTLGTKDGLVGIVEDVEPMGQQHEVELGLGASGLFHRHLVKFRMRRAAVHLSKYADVDCHCEGCRRRRATSENESWRSSQDNK